MPKRRICATIDQQLYEHFVVGATLSAVSRCWVSTEQGPQLALSPGGGSSVGNDGEYRIPECLVRHLERASAMERLTNEERNALERRYWLKIRRDELLATADQHTRLVADLNRLIRQQPHANCSTKWRQEARRAEKRRDELEREAAALIKPRRDIEQNSRPYQRALDLLEIEFLRRGLTGDVREDKPPELISVWARLLAISLRVTPAQAEALIRALWD